MTDQSSEKASKLPNEKPSKKSGATPTTPLTMPSSDEKMAAEPVRQAIYDALLKVDSPEKADETVRQLEENAAGQRTSEIAQTQSPASLDSAAKSVEKTGQAVPDSEKAASVLAQTARVIAKTKGRDSEAVAQAAQDVLNPELHGTPTPDEVKQREYLRKAILKRLKPIDALDTMLFLKINHLPHSRLLNQFFYFITRIFTGGMIWLAVLQIAKLRQRGLSQRAMRETSLPLILATIMVEVPLKRFFKRRRPFIKDIQAVAVGIKPNSWSFPSGHAAAAFAGAWLLKRYFPKQRCWLYAFASLGAFSRVYLGDHYPGDVISGSLLGVLFAKIFLTILKYWHKKHLR